MKFILALSIVCLFLAAWSHADNTKRIYAQWGLGQNHPGAKKASDVKFAELGLAGNQGKLAYTVGFGGWKDNTNYMGDSNIKTPSGQHGKINVHGGQLKEKARDTFFMEALFGVEPKSKHVYVSYKLGPAILDRTDCLLGSNLQISHEVGIGMRDLQEARVGIVYKHYSNAGLIKPNKGRDFIGMRMEF